MQVWTDNFPIFSFGRPFLMVVAGYNWGFGKIS